MLRQKLVPPPAWQGALPRPRLETWLDQAVAEGAHVGLFAGTGYGKTALLAAWARERGTLAWLTLDAEDADLDSFLTYLVAAFEGALPGFKTEARALLGRAREREGAFAALSALLADLDEQVDRPVLVAIDDYHLAASPSLDALLARLIRYLPPAVRLVVASRKPPEVELAMLQANRMLRLLDEPALAFDLDELRGLAPERGDAELRQLLASTGGWPAAMGMTPELLDAFLDEQLLAGLPAAEQAFLQRVAVVESFDAILCEEALGESFPRERRELLLRERLISVRGRDRYVLHPALRNLLARRFNADVARAERRALLQRVGDYHWQHGQEATGLRFWIEAGETERAATHLADVADAWLAGGRLEALASALDALGGAAETPALLLLRGELHRRWGDFALAERFYERAVAAGAEGVLLARARIGRAQAEASRGNVALAREQLAGLAGIEAHPALAIDAGILEGGLALLSGETDRAIARYEAALHLGRRLGDGYAQARAIHNLGICYIRLGEFQRALDTYDQALGLLAPDGTPLVWMAPINRALVLIHLGEVAEATKAAEATLALVRRYKLTREEGYALRILGFASLRGGALEAAAACFAAAEHLARAGHDALGLAYSLNFQAELALARQDLAAASRLVTEVSGVLGGDSGVLDFAQTRARVLLATGEEAAGRELVQALLARARAQGYVNVAREMEALDAAALPAPVPTPAPQPVAELAIRCFGGLRVTRAGHEVTDREWQTARARQLLAFLLFTPEGASKTHLLETVFSGEEVSNDLMNTTLMRLRKALEPKLEKGQPSRYILRTDARYVFNRQASFALDVDAFEAAMREARPGAPGEREALERALSLYRGELLPELTQPWAVALRLRYQELALDACRRLLAMSTDGAVWLRRALDIDPVSEEFNRELILRYLEAGEPHLARQHYQLCERRFRDMLDQPPPPDLAALVAR